MKHRSVIAFVIVAAALFAAPQLAHDLQSLKSALGACLRGQLLHAFLSVPTPEGQPAAVAPAPAEAQLASCQKGRPAAKPRKTETAPPARAGVSTPEPAGDELAMIVEPLHVSERWSAAPAEAPLAVAAESRLKALGEMAMIIPPDGGIDPREAMRAAANVASAGERAARTRKLAEQVRMTYVAAGFDAKSVEWRKADESLRQLEENFPGPYEFRVERDGAKPKVLKVKRVAGANCPSLAPAACAPRAPRPAGGDAPAAPLPVPPVGVVSAFVSE